MRTRWVAGLRCDSKKIAAGKNNRVGKGGDHWGSLAIPIFHASRFLAQYADVDFRYHYAVAPLLRKSEAGYEPVRVCEFRYSQMTCKALALDVGAEVHLQEIVFDLYTSW